MMNRIITLFIVGLSVNVYADSLEKIDFGKSQTAQLSKAIAILESIKLDGMDCDWALKVTRKNSTCTKFIREMSPNGAFEQVGKILVPLANDLDFAESHAIDIGIAARLAKDCLTYWQFATYRLTGQ
jgi:hypothetical protein